MDTRRQAGGISTHKCSARVVQAEPDDQSTALATYTDQRPFLEGEGRKTAFIFAAHK